MTLGASHWNLWLWFSGRLSCLLPFFHMCLMATYAVVVKGSIEAHRICLFGQVNDVMTFLTFLYRVTLLPYILFAFILVVAISAGDLVIYRVFFVAKGEILILFTMNLVFTNHIYRRIPHLGMHSSRLRHLLTRPLSHNCTKQNDGP